MDIMKKIMGMLKNVDGGGEKLDLFEEKTGMSPDQIKDMTGMSGAEMEEREGMLFESYMDLSASQEKNYGRTLQSDVIALAFGDGQSSFEGSDIHEKPFVKAKADVLRISHGLAPRFGTLAVAEGSEDIPFEEKEWEFVDKALEKKLGDYSHGVNTKEHNQYTSSGGSAIDQKAWNWTNPAPVYGESYQYNSGGKTARSLTGQLSAGVYLYDPSGRQNYEEWNIPKIKGIGDLIFPEGEDLE